MRIILVTASLLSELVAGCGGSSSTGSGGRTQVVAAFYPLAYAAEVIGGNRVEVDNLTPAGAEPHDLEATPGDVSRIHSAGLVLLLGHGFQPQIEDAAGSGKRVLKLLDTPGLKVHRTDDPHVWLDPLRYALLVQRIGAALGGKPAARRLVVRLRALDREYRHGLAHCRRHEIVTGHEAFAYLAERYGLEQVAITGINPEAEPSPRTLQRVIRTVRRTGATTVYTETLLSPRIAETVARETGATTAVLNPIEGLTKEQESRGDDYFTLMRQNLAALRTGLGCR
jgi:zinc transport system substrate-binding protein